MTKIGFIGLGIMGSRMAANLQAAGHQLVVYNRSSDKAAALVANGAVQAASPAEVGKACSLVFTMLAHPDAVQEAATGPTGFLPQMQPGQLWVDCSTVNPSFSAAMAQAAAASQIHFLDAPVAGTKAPAEKGELIFFVGGTEADLATAQPYFDIMGSKTIYNGGHSMGSAMKMLVNLLLGHAMTAFAEAVALGQALGLPQERLLAILPNTAVAPPFLKNLTAKLASKDDSVNFPLQWMRKDLQLATHSAYEQNLALPLTNAVKELFAQAQQQGLGQHDFSDIFHTYQK